MYIRTMFRHLKLTIVLAISASNESKIEINNSEAPGLTLTGVDLSRQNLTSVDVRF